MKENTKAQEYKKRLAKQGQAQVQQDNNQQQQIVISLGMRLLQLERRTQSLEMQLGRAQASARASEYRSSALANLLNAQNILPEVLINNEMERLQVSDFNENSDIDDKNRNLTEVTGHPVETGMFAILTIKFNKDGQELLSERVLRSKVEIGKGELFQGLDEAVLGMNIGESKVFPLNLQDKTDSAEITLLGLRTVKLPAQETQTNDQTN